MHLLLLHRHIFTLDKWIKKAHAVLVLENTSTTERTLIRTIAGSSRLLSKDLNLSPLQAIDRLQKLTARFQEHWYGTPWLVLVDGYVLPASVPVAKMLEEVEKHGKPIGIVGVAQITTRQDSVLVMNFCRDEQSRHTVERSAQAAKDMADKANEQAAQIAREIVEREMHERHGGQE